MGLVVGTMISTSVKKSIHHPPPPLSLWDEFCMDLMCEDVKQQLVKLSSPDIHELHH